MKVLYVSSASRVYMDENDVQYLNHHITNEGFMQFKNVGVDLKILLRYMGRISSKNSNNYERFSNDCGELKTYPNVYCLKGLINIRDRVETDKIIKKCVLESDRVICGTCSGFVGKTTVKYCKRFNKPYLVLCLGYTFEGQWYHSLKGKLIAIQAEYRCHRIVEEAPYVIYVTEDACQKRYPTKGESIGCSDVELNALNDEVLERRLAKINTFDKNKKIIIGTAASLNVKWKGQQIVLKAIKMLKNNGYCIEYQCIGLGDPNRLIRLAERIGVKDSLKILGSKQHDEVFRWMDELDIYIQPSYQEGLCRSIVEAMSRACPVICTDVGGNYELINKKHMVRAGDYKNLSSKIQSMLCEEELKNAASQNFQRAKEYESTKLKARRLEFYKRFFFGKTE